MEEAGLTVRGSDQRRRFNSTFGAAVGTLGMTRLGRRTSSVSTGTRAGGKLESSVWVGWLGRRGSDTITCGAGKVGTCGGSGGFSRASWVGWGLGRSAGAMGGSANEPGAQVRSYSMRTVEKVLGGCHAVRKPGRGSTMKAMCHRAEASSPPPGQPNRRLVPRKEVRVGCTVSAGRRAHRAPTACRKLFHLPSQGTCNCGCLGDGGGPAVWGNVSIVRA